MGIINYFVCCEYKYRENEIIIQFDCKDSDDALHKANLCEQLFTRGYALRVDYINPDTWIYSWGYKETPKASESFQNKYDPMDNGGGQRREL